MIVLVTIAAIDNASTRGTVQPALSLSGAQFLMIDTAVSSGVLQDGAADWIAADDGFFELHAVGAAAFVRSAPVVTGAAPAAGAGAKLNADQPRVFSFRRGDKLRAVAA